LRRILFGLTLAALLSGAVAAQEKMLAPIWTPKEFQVISEDDQAMYVAGLIDGMSFVQYGYSLPNYGKWIECIHKKTVGETTKELLAFLRENANFQEGVSSAFSQMLGRRCKH
jgi:hypothetical protein